MVAREQRMKNALMRVGKGNKPNLSTKQEKRTATKIMVVHIPMVSTLQVPLLVCILQKMRSTHTHNNMLTKKGGGEKGRGGGGGRMHEKKRVQLWQKHKTRV